MAGRPVPDFTRLALGLVLDSDATVADDGTVVGDPTEAALVVLAAKLGVDAEETRRAYPRLAEVPFDSEYKFMATFHRVTIEGMERVIELVKGGPDVVLARCSQAGGPLSGTGPDGAGARRDRRGQRPDGRERSSGPCLRGAVRRRRRAAGDGRRPDGAECTTWRSSGMVGHHRPAARLVEGGRADGAQAPASTSG